VNPEYEHLLLYFDRDVLASYRQSPDRYGLDEDEMGGTLRGDSTFLRFAFRRLEDRRVRVAVFRPDFEELSERDKRVWSGFHTGPERFYSDDGAFGRWVERNFEGSWEIEDGPIVQIPKHLRKIQAMTRLTLKRALFRASENPDLAYPAAENTKAYTAAHLALYALVVDGLDRDVIAAIAANRRVTLSNQELTLNSLNEILPAPLRRSVHAPLKKCAKTRQNVHGVRSEGTQPFPAFDTFHQDLLGIEAALGALESWIAKILDVSADACLKREESMAGLFPEIVAPPMPREKTLALEQAVGRTIASVRIGAVRAKSYLHDSEAMEIHFTDGTVLSISIGSNAANVTDTIEGMEPDAFHTDLMLFWAPSIKGVDVDR
jgi:hypothetical protein